MTSQKPVTRGQVKPRGKNCASAHNRWFNDLSTAGEWFHTNILLWLFCDPRGPADMILARACATKAAAAAAGLSPWQDPDSCPHARFDPGRDLWNRARTGRRITLESVREKMSQPLYVSRMQSRERQSDSCQQRTAVFGDRLNSLHGLKFLGDYAV